MFRDNEGKQQYQHAFYRSNDPQIPILVQIQQSLESLTLIFDILASKSIGFSHLYGTNYHKSFSFKCIYTKETNKLKDDVQCPTQDSIISRG